MLVDQELTFQVLPGRTQQPPPCLGELSTTSVARRGSGSGSVHSSLEEAVTEESVNHGGLLQFGVEQQCQD